MVNEIKPCLIGMTTQELQQVAAKLSMPKFTSRQMQEWIYGKIVDGKYYAIASIMAEALNAGGFTSEDKCTKGFIRTDKRILQDEKAGNDKKKNYF